MPESSKRQIFSFGESQLKERGAIVKKYIEAYTGTCEAGACNAEDAEKTVKAVEDVVIASFGVHLDTKSQDIVRSLVRCWWNEVRQSRQQAWVAHTKHADVDGEGQGVEHEMEAPVLSNMNEAAQQEAERGPGGQGKAEDEAAVQAQKKMEEAADADTGQFNGKSPDLQTSEKLQTKGFAAKPQVEGAVVAQSDGLPALKLKGKAQAMGGERADTAQPNSKACSPKGNRKGKSGKAQGQVKRPRNEGDEDPGRLEEEPDADREAEAEAEGKVQAVKVDEAQSNGERVVTWDEVVEAKDQRRSARAGAEEGAGRPKAQMEVHRAEANAHRADTESKGKAMTAKAGPETGAPCDEQDGDIKDVVQHQSKRRRPNVQQTTVGKVGCKEAATDLTEEDAELCEERRSQRVRKPRVIYNAEVEYQVPGNDTDSRGTSATKRQKTHGDTQVSTGAAHDSKESQEDESVDAVEIKPKQLPFAVPQYADLQTRLGSFRDWERMQCPNTATVNPRALAEAGFYHHPFPHEPDRCVCFYCGEALCGWDPNDIPTQEHKRFRKHCAFLKRLCRQDAQKRQDAVKMKSESSECDTTDADRKPVKR
mmetsp:Transcript_64109/g.107210  ORF Transcript_64109/g.107210 Transcript_64109/m.107210 type:complete len:593 (+) Transcript_64109:22-1800(+)